MNRTEIRQAFVWTCDNCGRDQYENAVHIEDPQLIADIREEYGYGDLLMAPSTVKCNLCSTEYDTTNIDERTNHLFSQHVKYGVNPAFVFVTLAMIAMIATLINTIAFGAAIDSTGGAISAAIAVVAGVATLIWAIRGPVI